MKRVFIYLVLSLSLGGQIMITEVMYNPAGADSPNEFVEIYNTSDFPADITGWSIADLAATDRLLDSAGASDIILPSLTYAVIFEGDYDGLMYQGLVPDSALILFTHTTTIGNTLGNTSDSLFLLDSSAVTVARTGWNEPAPAGFSRERIRLDYPDQAANWSISRDSLGTPGAENSVRPNTIDGAILTDSLNINPPVINSNETTTLSVLVANIGRETFSGLLLVTTDTSTIASTALPELAEMETLRVVIDITEINSGSHTWLVRLEIVGDEDPTNNSGYITLGVRYQP
ncbi:MAG: lamin tail domain-containing protein, partial [Candidatus Marinimicrobia bacterium]|nr:lamin tail domain-containing protein [Candidatus Neomarinimicrobiota bacterium]